MPIFTEKPAMNSSAMVHSWPLLIEGTAACTASNCSEPAAAEVTSIAAKTAIPPAIAYTM